MYDSPATLGQNAINKQSPVANLSQQCTENLKRLHDTISQMEARLDHICVPSPVLPPNNGKDTAPTPAVSSHVMFLGSTAMAIEDAAIRISRIMSRLEL